MNLAAECPTLILFIRPTNRYFSRMIVKHYLVSFQDCHVAPIQMAYCNVLNSLVSCVITRTRIIGTENDRKPELNKICLF